MRIQEASAVLRNEPEEPEGLELIMVVKLCESFCLFIRKLQSNETQTAAQSKEGLHLPLGQRGRGRDDGQTRGRL